MTDHRMTATLRPPSPPRAGRPLLAVEFTGLGAGEDLQFLLSSLRDTHVHRVDPLDTEAAPTITGFAQQVVTALAARHGGAVIGSCTGAVVAVEIAAQLHRDGAEPDLVVLVNPQCARNTYLLEEHRAIATRLGANTTAEPAIDVADPVLLHADLLKHAESFAIAQGIPAEDAAVFAADLCDRYRAWFDFLAATARHDLPPIDTPVVIIVDESVAAAGLWKPFADLSPETEVITHHDGPALTSPPLRDRLAALIAGDAQ
ncbi:hypothetical protein [Catellatospora citrea]|uniref:Thioesterase domain-containing protein n=1 Tax=Catellatospora citrea TaxID=53366 RepID=A0A8J3KD51_9ACTN|nr:hypothetical protein [Catellatospora citrea]RKE05530.1 hypothetical protein C8E86_0332 [Catellatospora citrea]GIF96878.1 hypothetical protein Cci01nite_19720 [Catellatospora citrea]